MDPISALVISAKCHECKSQYDQRIVQLEAENRRLRAALVQLEDTPYCGAIVRQALERK